MSASEKTYAAADLLVALCVDRAEDVGRALDAARAAGLADDEIDELLLLGPLYAGYPRTLGAFALWRERRPTPAAAGAAAQDRAVAGRAAFEAVYGERSERVLEELRRLHPALRDAIVEDAYGRTLARGRLPLKLKELCAVPVLIATDAPRQLASHVLGSRRAGATDAEIYAAAEAARRRVEPGRMEAGLARIAATLGRADGPAPAS